MKPILTALHHAIWDTELDAMPGWKVRLVHAGRIAYAVGQDIVEGQLTLRAMSLVYTTLLSLVPLLALSFSVLKGFGVHNQIEPLLKNFLTPLGPRGAEITEQVIGFVDNVRAGVLGSMGLALLLYTVVSLIQKIEQAFNFVWHSRQSRSVGQRFSNYLSVIFVGPVLMFTAVGITASVTNTVIVQQLAAIEPFGTAIELLGRLIPFLLVAGAFTFVYAFMPNAHVRLRSALIGGGVAGVLWQAAGFGFANFVARSTTRYTAIYSGFAILVIFMIWLYVSWLILLVGASICFYHQHPEYLLAERRNLRLSSRFKDKLALLTMLVIGREHYQQGAPWTLDRLTQHFGIPVDATAGILDTLERQRILIRTADDPPGYVPQRALETIRVGEVLTAIRTDGDGPFLNPDRLPAESPVDALLGDVDEALHSALANRTLKELVQPESRTGGEPSRHALPGSA